MEHLTKLLRDSYDLQENKPEKSAYWHLQKLRSEIKQLTLNDVVKKSELLRFLIDKFQTPKGNYLIELLMAEKERKDKKP
jgi:hypothetical protein